MNARVLRGLAAFGAGVSFGSGLIVSGMTKPQKVIGFLDVRGAWDPSLLLVMLSAVSVHFFAYRLAARREAALAGEPFALPTRRSLDPPLLAGAAIFGVGWGLGGYCPGPSIVSLASGAPSVVCFVFFVLVGAFFARKLEKFLVSPNSTPRGIDRATVTECE